MKVGSYTTGDKFLIFRNFPFQYDTSNDLPFKIAPNISLALRPHEIFNKSNIPTTIDEKEYNSLIDYIAPGYNLNLSYENFCFYSPIDNLISNNHTVDQLYFVTLSCLRIIKPYKINIAGSFSLGDEDSPIDNPKLYWLETPWSPEEKGPEITNVYTFKILEICYELVKKILCINDKNCSNFISAFILFSQVTHGATQSYQMAFITLYSALEALFRPDGTKSKTLGRRVSKFLKNIDSKIDIEQFISNNYYRDRNIVHGIQDITSIFSRLSDKKKNNFSILHEITRLCILGFLDMEFPTLENFTSCDLPKASYANIPEWSNCTFGNNFFTMCL